MAIKKQFLKSKPICKVTLTVPKEVANGAKVVAVAGDFNSWSTSDALLKKNKTGEWKTTLSLESGNEYQFRYCIDGENWINDTEADKYVANGLGDADNSVVIC